MSFALDSFASIATSCTSLFCVQPMYALKTAKQNQLKITFSPKILWGGYASNALGDALSFSTQYHIYKNKDQLPINHSLIGGLAGGVIANISEQFMDKHRFFRSQNLSNSYLVTIQLVKKQIGQRFFIRGLSGTATREISYNYAWTQGVQKLEKQINQIFEINHPYLARILSSVSSGLILTMMNHPFDTYKSKIHNDSKFGYLQAGGLKILKDDIQALGFKKTFNSLVKESYKGAVFRSGIISFSLFLNEPLLKTYHLFFDDKFSNT